MRDKSYDVITFDVTCLYITVYSVSSVVTYIECGIDSIDNTLVT